MNDEQVQLVQESWEKVEPIAPTAAELFYGRLFELAPGVRSLFPDDMTDQKRKLMKMIGSVVTRLGRLDTVVPQVQALGRRHVGYGAAPGHYDVVGDCLIWTLGQGLGEDFTPELQEAWMAAYGILASTMIDAASVGAQAN